MRSSASSPSSACCVWRVARCKRYAIRAGLVCLLLLAAVGPVAAQDEEPLRGAQAIVDGAPSPVPAEQSLQVMKILNGIYESQKTGREVML